MAHGTVDLGRDRFDLVLSPQAKSLDLNLAVPVTVRGPIADPTFGLDEGDAARRLVSLLGSVVFPPAAVGAFVDFGSAKSNGCLALAANPKQSPPAAEPSVGDVPRCGQGQGRGSRAAAPGSSDAEPLRLQPRLLAPDLGQQPGAKRGDLGPRRRRGRIDQPIRLVGADLGREQPHQAPVRELGRRQRIIGQRHPLTGPGRGQGEVAVVEARSATDLDLGGARRRQPFAPVGSLSSCSRV